MTSSSFSELFCISTHALTEGDSKAIYNQLFHFISTHALTEGDSPVLFLLFHHLVISTHALTEGDHRQPTKEGSRMPFQLTPSRRATVWPW